MSKFEFSPGSYSERCKTFFDDDHEWSDTPSELVGRVVTWAQYPNRYLLTEYGSEINNFLRRTRVQHKMYELALMSAVRTSDKMQSLESWYVVQTPEISHEQVFHMGHLVDPQAPTVITNNELKNDMLFMIDNDMCTPNSEDILRLDAALKLGQMDGYERLLSK